MNEIAKRLKELREERDLTMDLLVMDLNEKFDIEIHKSNLSRWEAGLVEPQLRYAVCLAQYFNVRLFDRSNRCENASASSGICARNFRHEEG